MIIKSATFLTSATMQSQYPDIDCPEVAFSGRSNVGKSSLINVLLNRKRLVKTSSTPGRTQLINFFLINNGILSFVDLPGFGYAKVPLHVKKKWGPMIETYFKKRTTLRVTVLIMDVRREPKEEELNLIDWLDLHQIPLISVLTKTDKLSKNKLLNQIKTIENKLQYNRSNLILFSAKTKLGRKSVWSAITSFL